MCQNKPLLICCRAPDVLKDLAPGSQPPFLIYNDEVKTDTNKIEEFLEETLAPPQWAKGILIQTYAPQCFQSLKHTAYLTHHCNTKH